MLVFAVALFEKQMEFGRLSHFMAGRASFMFNE
jgi:hypothetical protein